MRSQPPADSLIVPTNARCIYVVQVSAPRKSIRSTRLCSSIPATTFASLSDISNAQSLYRHAHCHARFVVRPYSRPYAVIFFAPQNIFLRGAIETGFVSEGSDPRLMG